MASNTSATGGYLTPTNSINIDDTDLDHIFHDLFAGVTGLDNTLVRPRWVLKPSNMLDRNTTWISFGVIDTRNDTNPSQWFDNVQGMILINNQELDVQVSCYGPNAAQIEGILRDGLNLDQNREVIDSLGIVLVDVGKAVNTSELINTEWVKRVETKVTFRKQIRRVYAVLSLEAAAVDIHSDDWVDDEVNHVNITQ
jgi:hypothetical protein